MHELSRYNSLPLHGGFSSVWHYKPWWMNLSALKWHWTRVISTRLVKNRLEERHMLHFITFHSEDRCLIDIIDVGFLEFWRRRKTKQHTCNHIFHCNRWCNFVQGTQESNLVYHKKDSMNSEFPKHCNIQVDLAMLHTCNLLWIWLTFLTINEWSKWQFFGNVTFWNQSLLPNFPISDVRDSNARSFPCVCELVRHYLLANEAPKIWKFRIDIFTCFLLRTCQGKCKLHVFINML